MKNKSFGERAGRFFRSSAFLIIAVAVLFVLLASSVSRTASPNVKEQYDVPLSSLGEGNGGLDLEPEKPISIDAETLGGANVAVIRGEGVAGLKCYFSEVGSDGKMTAAKSSHLDDGRVVFFTYSDSLEALEFRADAKATVSQIRLYLVDGYDFSYKINLISAVFFLLFLGILVVFERKTALFRKIFASILAVFSKIKEKKVERGTLHSVLYAATLTAVLAYAVLAFLDFTLGVIGGAYHTVLFVFAVLAAAGIIIFNSAFAKRQSVQRSLFLLLLVAGSFMILSSPVTTQISWDDGYHYANSAYVPAIITNGYLPVSVVNLGTEQFGLGVYGAHSSDVVGSILAGMDYAAFLEMPDMAAVFSSLRWYYIFLIPLLPFVLVYYIFDYIAYIPAWISMTLIGAVGADYIKVFVFAKLVNLLIFAVLSYFALRRLKSGKYIFSAIALMPVSVFLAGSFTCDWWINGAMMLGIAYFIGAMQRRDEKLSAKEIFIMIFFMAFATGPKQIYFFMMLPLFFIPKDKFKSKRSALVTKLIVLLVMIAILLTFAVPMFIDPTSRTDSRGGSEVSSSGQIKFILENPIDYAIICLRFMTQYLSLDYASYHLSMFGWMRDSTYVLFSLVTVMAFLFCMFTDRKECDSFRGSLAIRSVSLLTVFAQIVLVVTSLYVAFTPVGSATVSGCQYRYIFVTYPLVFWCLGSFRIENKMKDSVMSAVVFSLMSFAAVVGFYTVGILPLI